MFDASSNRIESLDSTDLPPSIGLNVVYLNHNRITYIDANVFANTPNIGELHLHVGDLII